MRKRTFLVPNEQLKRERKARFWSQQYHTRHIGKTTVNVSRWECGATTPGLHYSHELCKLFEKSPQELGLMCEEVAPREDEEHKPQVEHRPGTASPPETWLYDASVPLPHTAVER